MRTLSLRQTGRHNNINLGANKSNFTTRSRCRAQQRRNEGGESYRYFAEESSRTTTLALPIGALTFRMPSHLRSAGHNPKTTNHSQISKICWLHVWSHDQATLENERNSEQEQHSVSNKSRWLCIGRPIGITCTRIHCTAQRETYQKTIRSRDYLCRSQAISRVHVPVDCFKVPKSKRPILIHMRYEYCGLLKSWLKPLWNQEMTAETSISQQGFDWTSCIRQKTSNHTNALSNKSTREIAEQQCSSESMCRAMYS